MRDLYNNCTVKDLVPAVNTGYSLELAGSLTVNGTSVDLKGEGRRCLLVISLGATSTITAILSITSGTDNSTFGTSEYSKDLNTNGITVVDLTPSNRYIRAEYTTGATSLVAEHSYVAFNVKLVVFNERYRPSNVS